MSNSNVVPLAVETEPSYPERTVWSYRDGRNVILTVFMTHRNRASCVAVDLREVKRGVGQYTQPRRNRSTHEPPTSYFLPTQCVLLGSSWPRNLSSQLA